MNASLSSNCVLRMYALSSVSPSDPDLCAFPQRNPSGKAQMWVVSDTGIGSPLWQALGDLGILTLP